MTRKSDDPPPQSPGGHAAERLREFLEQRFPGGTPTPESAPEQGTEAEDATKQEEDIAVNQEPNPPDPKVRRPRRDPADPDPKQ
jgi:hypothetical protein